MKLPIALLRKGAAVAIWFAATMSVRMPPARAADAPLKPNGVETALEKARKYLYSKQNSSGTWEEVEKPEDNGDENNGDVKGRQWGGLTSISTYALLAANESPQDEKLARAIKFLKTADIRGIYALGLRCQVWLLLKEDKSIRPFIVHDHDILLRALHQGAITDKSSKDKNTKSVDTRLGFYSYYFDRGPRPIEWYDHSVSQYGVLGMWALEQSGAEVPINYWKLVDAAWRRAQLADGAWSYRQRGDGPRNMESGTGSMTAAGVATLFITQDYTQSDSGACRGNIVNPNIDRGLAWMDTHINEELVAGNYYTLYGIERIGVASGRKYFDTVNWYEVGAQAIVKNQKEDGSWNDNIPDTCFAVLFLSRGRAPVMFNKLQYDLTDARGKATEAAWNQRPRDVANFSRWMGRALERDLNWQAVNLNVPVEDLHDSSILYLSGNQELRFSAEEQQKLRTFVEQGGLILGNADCGSRAFSASFQKLGKELFPQPGYKFRELEATHPILTSELYHVAKGRVRVKITGLSNGVRELMLLIADGDLSRSWQAQAEKTHAEAYEAGANIFLYAVDKKNLRYKGEDYLVKLDPEIKATRSLSLRRLEVGANWNPEPGGWPRLAAIVHNQAELDLEIRPAKPDSADLAGAKIAHLTGTTAFQLSPPERAALKQFVQSGGTLIVDAAGGSSEFSESAEGELRAIFGDAADAALKEPLAPENSVFHLADGNIDAFHYRAFAKATLGNLRSPRIRAIPINGRLAVFYSHEDLSAGIVGESIDGILGYEPESATEIMRNLVLYVAGDRPPTTKPSTNPSTAPTTKATTAPATQPSR